ncbi:MAG: hypothetical protein R3D59_15530 [Paracoccaceae bacterium]
MPRASPSRCCCFGGGLQLHLGETFDPPMLVAFMSGSPPASSPASSVRGTCSGAPGPTPSPSPSPPPFQRRHPRPADHRARHGTEALAYNYAIIAFHAPYVYVLG